MINHYYKKALIFSLITCIQKTFSMNESDQKEENDFLFHPSAHDTSTFYRDIELNKERRTYETLLTSLSKNGLSFFRIPALMVGFLGHYASYPSLFEMKIDAKEKFNNPDLLLSIFPFERYTEEFNDPMKLINYIRNNANLGLDLFLNEKIKAQKNSDVHCLDLSGSGLTTLPKTIGALNKLKTLQLDGTYITSLPQELKQLENTLEVLNLQNIEGLGEFSKFYQKKDGSLQDFFEKFEFGKKTS